MSDDETLHDAASVEEQPASEAVAEAPSEPVTETPEAASVEEQPAARLYAGKYKSAEELEASYLDSQREASRMAGELAAHRKMQQPTPTADPSASQIEKYEKERNNWEQYASRDDITNAERVRAASQISRYDREIGKLEAKREFQQESTRSTASQSLEADALEVIKSYEKDLSPGSQLYQAAEKIYRNMEQAGHPANYTTQSLAVTLAAGKLGIGRSQAVQEDRKGFLSNLNKQAKAAVRNGAGTAVTVKPSAAPNFNGMSNAEFAKWERENVLGA